MTERKGLLNCIGVRAVGDEQQRLAAIQLKFDARGLQMDAKRHGSGADPGSGKVELHVLDRGREHETDTIAGLHPRGYECGGHFLHAV